MAHLDCQEVLVASQRLFLVRMGIGWNLVVQIQVELAPDSGSLTLLCLALLPLGDWIILSLSPSTAVLPGIMVMSSVESTSSSLKTTFHSTVTNCFLG